MSDWRQRLPMLGFQLGLQVVALAVLVWRVDVGAAFRELSAIDLRWAIAGVVVFSGSKLLHAYRWRVFLRHRPEIPSWHLAGLFLVSNMANAFIPLRAGDLLRIEVPSRRYGVSRAELSSSVLWVESLLDGVAFVMLLSVGLLFLDLPPALSSSFLILAVAVLVLFVVTVGTARARRRWNPESARMIAWLPERAQRRAGLLIADVLQGVTALGDTRSTLLTIGTSLVAWTAEIAVYWMMAQAFGIDLNLGEATLVMIAANLVVSLPLLPWNVGPYEVAVTEAMVAIGADRVAASAYAVGSHLLLICWITITGAAAMGMLRLSPRDLLPRGNRTVGTLAPPPAGTQPPER